MSRLIGISKHNQAVQAYVADMKHSSKWLPWLILSAIVLVNVWIRYGLIEVPFERDEGEYAYGGQLLLQGIPPYLQLYNMKLPGIYAAYAGVMAIFGQSHAGVHSGLLLVNSLSVVLVFFIGSHLLGRFAGGASAAAFAVLAMGQPVQGIFANAEHFVLLPVLVGVFLLLQGERRDDVKLLFISGFLFGTGFIIKQHGIFFLAWALVTLFFARFKPSRSWPWFFSRSVALCLGGVLPYLVTCLLLYKAGVFEKFWFWTFDYARAYTNQVAWPEAIRTLVGQIKRIISASPLLWAGVLAGLLVSLVRATRRPFGLLISFTCFSFLAICPGFYFRPHYFVLLLPAAALLFGAMAAKVSELVRDSQPGFVRVGISFGVVLLCLGTSLFAQRQFLFMMSAEDANRSVYWPNPFNESIKIADFLRDHSVSGDTVAIMGSEPQIFFYSGLHSASGYIYMYPLMENHDFALQMQREFIREIEEASPRFLMFVRNPYSWLQKKHSQTLVYEWFANYKERYQRVGLIETFEDSTRYTWEAPFPWPPASPYWIEVLRKNDD